MNRKLITYLQDNYKDVTLIMASKYLKKEDMDPYIEAGIRHFGENRVEAFLEKKEAIKKPVTWHFIGTLQTKKVKKVINEIDVLHTVDRIKLIDEIVKYRKTPLPVFIQFNISNEESKHGFFEEDIDQIIERLKASDVLIPVGVMGMALHSSDKTVLKNQFQSLIALKEKLNQSLKTVNSLSMGMSDDYDIALSLNTTHLRLGRVLLEEPC